MNLEHAKMRTRSEVNHFGDLPTENYLLHVIQKTVAHGTPPWKFSPVPWDRCDSMEVHVISMESHGTPWRCWESRTLTTCRQIGAFCMYAMSLYLRMKVMQKHKHDLCVWYKDAVQQRQQQCKRTWWVFRSFFADLIWSPEGFQNYSGYDWLDRMLHGQDTCLCTRQLFFVEWDLSVRLLIGQHFGYVFKYVIPSVPYSRRGAALIVSLSCVVGAGGGGCCLGSARCSCMTYETTSKEY